MLLYSLPFLYDPHPSTTKLGRQLLSGSTITEIWKMINRSSMNTNFSNLFESSYLPFKEA